MKQIILVSSVLMAMLTGVSAMAESNYNLAADREMLQSRDQVNDLNPQGTMERDWNSGRSTGYGDQRRTRTRLRKGSGGSNSSSYGGGGRGGGRR